MVLVHVCHNDGVDLVAAQPDSRQRAAGRRSHRWTRRGRCPAGCGARHPRSDIVEHEAHAARRATNWAFRRLLHLARCGRENRCKACRHSVRQGGHVKAPDLDLGQRRHLNGGSRGGRGNAAGRSEQRQRPPPRAPSERPLAKARRDSWTCWLPLVADTAQTSLDPPRQTGPKGRSPAHAPVWPGSGSYPSIGGRLRWTASRPCRYCWRWWSRKPLCRARHLRAPSATVSRRWPISKQHLGTPLLVRGRRGLALTDSGRAFVAASRRILGQLEEATRSGRRVPGRPWRAACHRAHRVRRASSPAHRAGLPGGAAGDLPAPDHCRTASSVLPMSRSIVALRIGIWWTAP